jgi:hypothetical protein
MLKCEQKRNVPEKNTVIIQIMLHININIPRILRVSLV